jgi:hypothetical protein
VLDALSALELIERHILTEKRFNGLRAVEAQKVIPDGRKEYKRRPCGADKAPGRAVSHHVRESRLLKTRRLVPRVLRRDDTPHGTLTTLPTTLPTALARGLLAPRRSTVTSNSSHHAVQLRVTLDRRSVLEPSSA